jgi:hypothetical protein
MITTVRVEMVSRWRAFLAAEAEHCSESQLIRLCSATEGAIRYESYLRMIRVRHASILRGLKSLDADIEPMTVADATLLERRGQFASGVTLEIETFYLFAKIYLDSIAQFVGRYFGPLRGLSTKSHDQLTKNFRAFREGHRLEVPDGVERQLIDLKHRIAEFRRCDTRHELAEETIRDLLERPGENLSPDVAVAHPANRWVGSVEDESKSLEDLASCLDVYTDAIHDLVFSTRARSRASSVLQRPEWPRNLSE